MSDDFVTRLRLQLREAALRDERRGAVGMRVVRARRSLPGPAPVAIALAIALGGLAMALAAVTLRGEHEPAASPKVIGTYRVATNLSGLAPGFGAAWAADSARGEILRIEPRTRRVVARIRVGGSAMVTTGAGAVWALAGDLQYAGDRGRVRLLRIDPATNRVVARIPLRTPAGKRFAPVDLQVRGGSVWVVGQPSGVLRIDARRNVPDLFLPLADRTGQRGVVTDGDDVWVLTGDARLREYDARTGRAVGQVPVRAPADAFLFWGPRHTLTVGRIGTNQLALVDRTNGRLIWRAALGASLDRFLYAGEALWAHVSSTPAGRIEPDRLLELDADSGRRLSQIDLPEPGVAGMATVGHDIWVATPLGKIVVVGRSSQ